MENFYEQLADDYDAMVGAVDRLELARHFVRLLRERFPFDRALDAACGTGLYALALAEAGGADVWGMDLSAAMLDVARQEAQKRGLKVEWQQAPMERMCEAVDTPFDVVLCLGNSLPHLLTARDLSSALRTFYELLRPGGMLVVQVLNYNRVLADSERIVEINRQGELEFVRFYDFGDPTVRFNILRMRWQADGSCEHHLCETELYPYQRHELADALIDAGFHELADYGSLVFEPFDPATSTTLMLTAVKPEEPFAQGAAV